VTPVGSLLLSYTGLGLGGVIFQGLCVAGAIMMYFSFKMGSFTMLFWGRGVYGMGCEVAIIIIATIGDKYFSGKMLSIALACNRVIAGLGTFIAAFIGPSVFIETRTMNYVLFLYFVFCYISFIMAVIYCFVEHRSDKKLARIKHDLELKKIILLKEMLRL
jgi:hypothetical protein